MFDLLAQGPFPHLTLTPAPSTFSLPPHLLPEVERTWQSAHRPGKLLFDGPMVRLESFHVDRGHLHLATSPTSYRLFLATNMAHPEWADEHGLQALANPLGLSVGLLTADRHLLMGRRNSNVAYYPDRIHPFAGALEPTDLHTPLAGPLRELSEELSLPPDQVTDLLCLALAADRSLRQPELIFHARTPLTLEQLQSQLDPAEHASTWSTPATEDAVAHALSTPTPFTPIALATLLLTARHLFGDEWFRAHRPA